MKVIFLQDVPHMAKAGETKEVADGYGKNYLIPKNIAVLASASATKLVAAQEKNRAHAQARLGAELAELAGHLDGKEITIAARTSDQDRLFGSITNTDIASELANVTGITIDKKKIELEEPIRHLGSYDITIKLAKDMLPRIKVTVVQKEAG